MRHRLLLVATLAACGGSTASAPSNASNASSMGAAPLTRTCVKEDTGCLDISCIDAVAFELIKDQTTLGCKTGDGTAITPSERQRAVAACYQQATCAATADDCEWTRTRALETCLANAPSE